MPSGSVSNFLVLRIKAQETIRVSHAWESGQLWEGGPENVAFVLLFSINMKPKKSEKVLAVISQAIG